MVIVITVLSTEDFGQRWNATSAERSGSQKNNEALRQIPGHFARRGGALHARSCFVYIAPCSRCWPKHPRHSFPRNHFISKVLILYSSCSFPIPLLYGLSAAVLCSVHPHILHLSVLYYIILYYTPPPPPPTFFLPLYLPLFSFLYPYLS